MGEEMNDRIRDFLRSRRDEGPILVVDKSGSMSWRDSDGLSAHELVQAAIERFMTTISDLDIYFNIVFFDNSVRTLRKTSEKTALISGISFSSSRSLSCCFAREVPSPTLGARMSMPAKEPSSSWGMNSAPSRE